MALNHYNRYDTDGTGLSGNSLIFNGNTRRRALVISASGSDGTTHYDIRPMSVLGQGLFHSPSGQFWQLFEYKDLGQLLCEPWYIWIGTGGFNISVIEILLD